MTVSESSIEFTFPPEYDVLKFDDTKFYRRSVNSLPDSKAMDFIASSPMRYLLIEVKNCVGNEADNRWRIDTDNRKRDTAATTMDVSDRDSIDIEISQKTAMTIAALVGALTDPVPHAMSRECIPFAQALCDEFVQHGTKKLFAILLLEGDFGNGLQTRTSMMIRQRIQQSIANKLKWLNCTVLVEDTQSLTSANLSITARRTA